MSCPPRSNCAGAPRASSFTSRLCKFIQPIKDQQNRSFPAGEMRSARGFSENASAPFAPRASPIASHEEITSTTTWRSHGQSRPAGQQMTRGSATWGTQFVPPRHDLGLGGPQSAAPSSNRDAQSPWIFLSFKPLQKFQRRRSKRKGSVKSVKSLPIHYLESSPAFTDTGNNSPLLHSRRIRLRTCAPQIYATQRRRRHDSAKMAPGPRKIFIALSDQMRNF